MGKKLLYVLVAVGLFGCKNDIQESKVSVEKQSSQIPVVIPTISNQATEELPKIVKPSYSPNLKSVSTIMAIEKYRKGEYYESIASFCEGWRGNLYRDNVGLAWGFGWNVSKQSKNTNEWLATTIGIQQRDKSLVVALSGQDNPSSMPQVSITPDQGIQAVSLMRKNFEGGNGIRSIIKPDFYDKLKPNEQAALVYHTYKVGPGGASRYKTMISYIREYVKNPTREQALKIGGEFKYSYMLRGQKLYDTRSGAYLAALFVDPQAYGAMIGANSAPTDLPSILAVAGMKNIDTSKPIAPQVDAQDEFGKVKEDMLLHGERYELAPLEVRQTPTVHVQPGLPTKHLPHGYM